MENKSSTWQPLLPENRPQCQMSWCDVEIDPKQSYCAGHIYLNKIDQRKTEKFAKKSKELLKHIKGQ